MAKQSEKKQWSLKVMIPGAILFCAITGVWIGISARADYPASGYFYRRYNPYTYYGNSGRLGSQNSSIISLDLDEHDVLNSSFRIAAREGRLADMKKFLEQGADVNSASKEGETALMYASRNCAPKVVEVLLDAKAEVNFPNHEGRTALMYASMDSCLPVVKLLLKVSGIKLHLRDRIGKSAQDYAEEGSELYEGGSEFEVIDLLKSHRTR